ncbi:YopX family protein [Pyramidobacter piscolens]|uniref:YopX family protein n=1 Tax=Pyramidobacter piscolens TaxID=638849 RepID=UPI002AB23E7E|nr:YopX family protein [Pyramidobacter piscolens]
MRVRKCRGFSKKKNKWLYSKLHMSDFIPPESVGQYTELKDSEGQEIYEGDIVDFELLRGKKSRGCVEYSNARYVVRFQRGKYERALSWVCAVGKPVIIGNTYENPELLEQERPNA